ncbi:MAG: isochorismatase family protein [Ruminococcaceae bacterium]|nr:isochorismatase family protein [Oscillospiraceae bacterium]
MHIWEDMLTDDDRAVIEKGHYGQPRGFGKKPLLLIIDLQPNYIGADKPIAEQLDEWPSGGGEACWRGVEKILSLRDVARECNVPIFYTRNVQNATNLFDSFATKTKRNQTKYIDGAPEAELLDCVKPLPTEMIIPKSYASAFYGTPLQSYLIKLGIDTLIIVGGSTSGCCRATAVDAVTRNYNLGYVEDCLFDRITISHKAALLDVWMKYGDVVMSDYVKEYFYSLKKDGEGK